MYNKRLEALIYFLLAGLALFLCMEFEPAGNTSEFRLFNIRSWIGQRTGRLPFTLFISSLSLFYFYKSIRLQRSH